MHVTVYELILNVILATPRYLQQYTSDRQRSVVPMAAVVEGLQLLYTSDCTFPKNSNREALRRFASSVGLSDAVLSIRGLGVDLLNSNSSIKVCCSFALFLITLIRYQFVFVSMNN